MNEVIQTILNRRTCRSFTGETVNREDVETLLDCALHAPSAMNRQAWKFTAVMGQDKIQMLAKAVGEALSRGGDYDMYQPPVLIITSSERSTPFGVDDNACAMENIYLAASALGLGAVWINQVRDCCDEPKVREILDAFHIPKTHVVYGCAAVGHPAAKPNPREMKGESEIV